MSLILEALKKLEREKAQPDRGYLVLGAEPGRARSRGWAVALGLTALAALAVVSFRSGASRRAPTVSDPPRGTVAEAAPVSPVPTSTPRAGSPAAAPAPLVGSSPFADADREPAPTTPAAGPPAPASDSLPGAPGSALRLEAISRRDGQPVAILSGRLVREGDVLGNARVIRIGELEVEIEIGGTRSVLAF